MIENIGINNFKSLKDVLMVTRPLNLLAGLNAMGKSSFIQVLLLLKQSDGIGYSGQLKLRGWLMNIGKGKDALYQFAEEEKIKISLGLKGGESLSWSFSYQPDWEYLESGEKKYGKSFTSLMDGFQYLSAERIGPQTMHDVSQPSIENKILGVKGEYAIHYLQAFGNRYKVNKKLRHINTPGLTLMSQVNGWLQEISPGIKANIVEVSGLEKMLLNYEFKLGVGRTASYKPENVGFGVSYAISVITSLLVAEKGDIIIIENPEAHIHPKGQAQLGRLLALCASCGAQLFIETHSDHIINGIRVAVKESLIPGADVNFSWFNKVTTDNEQYTEITGIKVDEKGELSQYPKDFLDEWSNQLLKLV